VFKMAREQQRLPQWSRLGFAARMVADRRCRRCSATDCCGAVDGDLVVPQATSIRCSRSSVRCWRKPRWRCCGDRRLFETQRAEDERIVGDIHSASAAAETRAQKRASLVKRFGRGVQVTPRSTRR
jgi:hypothetical protein